MSDTPKTTAADAYEKTEALLCEMQGLRDQLAEVKWDDRDNLQDQRDFAMREIGRLNKEAAHKDKLLREMRAAIRMLADDSCKGWLL